jgi:single-strand DNA-binding protein
MAGVNKVILVGNLGADPELRYTASGTAVAKFRIATSERFTDREGNRQERTEWHRIVAWRKLAEICGQYLAKGKQVYIEGRIRNDSWEKDGVKQYSYEIVADNMVMLGGGRVPDREADAPFEPPPGGTPEDDIPF